MCTKFCANMMLSKNNTVVKVFVFFLLTLVFKKKEEKSRCNVVSIHQKILFFHFRIDLKELRTAGKNAFFSNMSLKSACFCTETPTFFLKQSDCDVFLVSLEKKKPYHSQC